MKVSGLGILGYRHRVAVEEFMVDRVLGVGFLGSGLRV